MLYGEDRNKAADAAIRGLEFQKYFIKLKKKMEKVATYKMEFTAVLVESCPGK